MGRYPGCLMNVLKRIVRGPVIWVLAGLVALFIAFQFIGGPGFREITTQQGLELLQRVGEEAPELDDRGDHGQ